MSGQPVKSKPIRMSFYETLCSMSESSVRVGNPESLTTEGTTLDRLLGMLERALVCNAQATQGGRPQQNVRWSFKCEIT